MLREIFEVYAKAIDANGAYNTLGGYPKVFDSRLYNNDIDKTKNKAYSEYYNTLGAMLLRDDRQAQIVMIINPTYGDVLEYQVVGYVHQLPDPEPEPDPEPIDDGEDGGESGAETGE